MANDVRADIIDTGNPYIKSASITINAPADVIFDLLARPREHARFDGSGTVIEQVSGPERLELGSKFNMGMKIKLPYRIGSQVVEFDEGRQIAWAHIGKHRWRYSLRSLDDGSTLVTETFDGSTARFPPALKLINAFENNQKAIAKTLVRLKELVESTP
jgi:hypothetical protein